jgi:hypothetical protein
VRVSPNAHPNNIRYARTTTNANARKTIAGEGDPGASDPPGLEKNLSVRKGFVRAEKRNRLRLYPRCLELACSIHSHSIVANIETATTAAPAISPCCANGGVA